MRPVSSESEAVKGKVRHMRALSRAKSTSTSELGARSANSNAHFAASVRMSLCCRLHVADPAVIPAILDNWEPSVDLTGI
jgi:hypothetical protein